MRISLVNRFLKKLLAKIVLEFMDCIGRVRSIGINGSDISFMLVFYS
jgi:hypothetical protein